jgi:hypothetical protein
MSDPSSEFGKSSSSPQEVLVAPWFDQERQSDKQTPEAYAEYLLLLIRSSWSSIGKRLHGVYTAHRDSYLDEDISHTYQSMEEPVKTLFAKGAILAIKKLNLEKPEDVKIARLMLSANLDDNTDKTILAIVTKKSELVFRDTDELKELHKVCMQNILYIFLQGHGEMSKEPWAIADQERFRQALEARNAALKANPSPT